MLVINPKYEHLRKWLEWLPFNFFSLGEVIYEERNQIRLIEHEGIRMCVKRFCPPRSVNCLVYTYLRKPKAQRAYENAMRLTEKGIATPEPIAYILAGRRLLTESYLITLESTLDHTMYDFRNGETEGKEELIRDFARFAASVHNAGVIHKDFSPGNILWSEQDGTYRFELVDINRMRFTRVGKRQGCRNLSRLWGKRDFFEILAPAYAEARGLPADKCLKWILAARKRFWKHHSHEHFVTDDTFSIGVIISTYNNPRWLEKVLWGLRYQTHHADEIIIADDGSGEETRELIQRYSTLLPLKHVWHEDNGFRKTTILNRAVCEAESDYLIFLDQDLIPRRDFVSQHYLHARKRRFVSGGCVLLPMETSEQITEEDVRTGRAWKLARQAKAKGRGKLLGKTRLYSRIMNIVTPTKASWNGGNASTWREYILNANGFDMRMRYGAEDREFGSRLENSGIHGIQLRYSLPLLHLYHNRPYRNEQDWQTNLQIWRETRRTHRKQTEYGIKQLQDCQRG